MSLIFPSTFASPTIDPLTMVVSFENIEMEPTSTIETVGDLTDAIQVTLENVAIWQRGLDLSDHISFGFFPGG